MTSKLDDGAQCPGCQRQNKLSDRFCRFCGTGIDTVAARLGADTVTSARIPARSPAPERQARPAQSRPAQPRRARPRTTPPGLAGRRTVTVAAGAVGVVAALALAAWLARWPGAVFGTRITPAAQVGAAAGVRSSPAASTSAPSSPAVSSTPPSSAPATPEGTASTPASPATSPAVTEPSTTSAPPAALPGGDPVATVRAYFAAITAKNYGTAWQLGGDNLGLSYQSYAAGYATTAGDKVTVLSVAGDTVAARITATQNNGSIKIFQGTYTVENGVITAFDVRQLS